MNIMKVLSMLVAVLLTTGQFVVLEHGRQNADARFQTQMSEAVTQLGECMSKL